MGARKQQLQVRVGLILVGVLLAFMLGLGLVDYLQSKKELDEQLRKTGGHVSSRLAQSLGPSLWDMDFGAAGKLIQSEMLDDKIAGIYVREKKDGQLQPKIVAHRVRNENWQPLDSSNPDVQLVSSEKAVAGEKLIRATQDIIQDRNGTVQVLGQVDLFMTRKFAEAVLRDSLIWIVARTLLLTVSIGVLLVVLLNSLIFKPLQMISKSAEQIAAGNIRQKIPYQSDDEIGALADSFRQTVDYINSIADSAARMSGGDFTVPHAARSVEDVLGRSFEAMRKSMSALLGSVSHSGDQLSDRVREVENVSRTLSEGARQQASTIQTISKSMVQVNSQSKMNAESAGQANRLMTSARGSVDHGQQQIETTLAAMQDILTSSQQIARINKAIDDIAFQTNLLALNAAVEAARAGKHGKGFAVVADEVRGLAGRSAKAARETTELIDDSGQKVQNGLEVTAATAKVFDEIKSGIAKVADLVAEISTASQSQSTVVDQVSQDLGEMDRLTQQNTAIAGETAGAAEELANQADELKTILQQFKVSQKRD